MEETIIANIFVPLVLTGLTGAAYSHPDAYKRTVMPVIYWPLGIGVAYMSVWNAAICHFLAAMIPLMTLEGVRDASRLADANIFPDWWISTGFLSLIYLFVLMHLHDLLDIGNGESKTTQTYH